MRIASRFHNQRDGLDVKMTPMIDVVFLLLIFFVWTASFQIVEHLLPSSLITTPGESAETAIPLPDDFDQVVVRILWQGSVPGWLINNNPASGLPQVKQTLAAVAKIKNDLPLIIDPDPGVPLGNMIDVYDLSLQAGFQEIQFAASEQL